MSMLKRFALRNFKPVLWLALLILSISFVAQYQFTHSNAKSQAQAYSQHIEKIELESEVLRQERLDSGALWLGVLHESIPTARTILPKSKSSVVSSHRRRIAIESVPVGSEGQYRVTFEIHECNPGLDTCSSGGSFRVTTAAGERLFRCEMGMLLTDPNKQSHYSLLWDEGAELLTRKERLHLLNEIAGGADQPSAATFLDNLKQAYCYNNHEEGPGKENALRLWRTVLKAIIAAS